jgi:serine/threonine protein kinase
MGVVFNARQVSLNRLVALKMILRGHFAHPKEVQRFKTEAEAAAGLAHPNLVGIYEVGEHQGAALPQHAARHRQQLGLMRRPITSCYRCRQSETIEVR